MAMRAFFYAHPVKKKAWMHITATMLSSAI
jgi:hypothetical protein